MSVGGWENEWESGRMGRREDAKMGGWEDERVEDGKM